MLQAQADEQVSANRATAFPIAAVIVRLCQDFADLLPLVLGYFYARCPYLVPYYPARLPSQTTEEYHR